MSKASRKAALETMSDPTKPTIPPKVVLTLEEEEAQQANGRRGQRRVQRAVVWPDPLVPQPVVEAVVMACRMAGFTIQLPAVEVKVAQFETPTPTPPIPMVRIDRRVRLPFEERPLPRRPIDTGALRDSVQALPDGKLVLPYKLSDTTPAEVEKWFKAAGRKGNWFTRLLDYKPPGWVWGALAGAWFYHCAFRLTH